MTLRSNILKACLFATGLSGIVAEYVLSTLATYFLGDSVFQWTIIVSIMLFAMGLGARLSKYIETNLINKFITIEFILSLLTAFSTIIAYMANIYAAFTGFVIYSTSIAIGLLIGMEIPLVIRINDRFELLKVNVSSILENDYYGSLVGGIFFAFIGLPYLGLKYTPFMLGAINLAVAFVLLYTLWNTFGQKSRRTFSIAASLVVAVLILGSVFTDKIIEFGETRKYRDDIIFSTQSRYQKITITQAKSDYWLFINSNQQLSTVDEHIYHEALVHPVVNLTAGPVEVLVLGGGDGCAARELLKHATVKAIEVVDLDPAMTALAKTHEVLTNINANALNDKKVQIINQDAFSYLRDTEEYFDIIIIDLPDPKSVELGRMYSYEFYRYCHQRLRPNGMIVTQAGSPYYAPAAFKCIDKTMSEAGFGTLPIHLPMITLGEWGMVIGSKAMSGDVLHETVFKLDLDSLDTRWLNDEVMHYVTWFGKDIIPVDTAALEVNRIHNPVLFKYYLNGRWDLY